MPQLSSIALDTLTKLLHEGRYEEAVSHGNSSLQAIAEQREILEDERNSLLTLRNAALIMRAFRQRDETQEK